MSSEKTNKGIALFLFLIIIAAGVWVRISATPQFLTVNIPSYYYDRSQYLLEHGHLPGKDIWSFAPDEMLENVPPVLAYLTVAVFRVALVLGGAFSFSLDFTDFVLKSPVFFFLLWGVLAVLFMKRFFSEEAIFVHTLFLAFVPAAITLTQGGKYSEELIGAPLVFFLMLFTVRLFEDESIVNFSGVFASSFLLALAWPQFPAPFLAAAVSAAFLVFLKRRRAALAIFSALVFSVFLGHIVSLYALKIDYSPIYMLGETWRGLINYNDPDLRLAMSRSDWANANPFDFFVFFGGAALLAFFAGLLRAYRFSSPARDTVIIIFSAVGLLLFTFFIKSISLFLPIFLFVSSYGGELLLSRARMREMFFAPLSRAFRLRQVRFAAKVVLAVATGAIIAVSVEYLLWRGVPRPVGLITVRAPKENIRPGKSYPFSIILENAGASTSKENRAFTGLHVEVKNADLHGIEAASPSGGRLVLKPDARSEDWYWFEAAFPALEGGEQGIVSFALTPHARETEIRVRGWLPGSCTFISRFAGISKRSGPYWNPLTEGWRSESCIQRIPAFIGGASNTAVPCAIDVFAGNRSTVKFQCEQYIFGQ